MESLKLERSVHQESWVTNHTLVITLPKMTCYFRDANVYLYLMSACLYFCLCMGWCGCLTGLPVFFLLRQVGHPLLQICHFLHQRQESTSDGEVTVTVYSPLLIQFYTWQNGEISVHCKMYVLFIYQSNEYTQHYWFTLLLITTLSLIRVFVWLARWSWLVIYHSVSSDLRGSRAAALGCIQDRDIPASHPWSSATCWSADTQTKCKCPLRTVPLRLHHRNPTFAWSEVVRDVRDIFPPQYWMFCKNDVTWRCSTFK